MRANLQIPLAGRSAAGARWPRRQWLAASVLGLSGLLAGCGGGSEDAPAADTRSGTAAATGTALQGWAHVQGPLVGAQVRVLSTDGRELARAAYPTHGTGAWFVTVPGLPADYTIEVSGGRDDVAAFEGRLRLSTRASGRDELPPAVNIATTLASHFQALQPGLSPTAVSDAVRRYLQIPASIDLHRQLRVSDRHFSAATWMGAKPATAGFDEHLLAQARLVVSATPRSYGRVGQPVSEARRRALGMRALDLGVSNQEAAELALAGMTGGPDGAAAAVGSLLISRIFGGDNGVAKALAEISAKLSQLSSQVAELSAQVEQVQQQLDDVAYAASVAPLSALIADIDDLWTLYEAIGAVNPEDAAALANARSKFRARMEKLDVNRNYVRLARLQTGLDDIHRALVSPLPGTQGVLRSWNDKVLLAKVSGHRFVTADMQANILSLFRYWRAKQVQLYVMNTDVGIARLAQDPDDGFFDPDWKLNYGTLSSPRFAAQARNSGDVDQLVVLAQGLVYDRATNVIWAANIDGEKITLPNFDGGPQPIAGRLTVGHRLIDFYPLAVARLKELTGLDGWSYPSKNLLKMLRMPVGAFAGPSGSGNQMASNFLIANGFGAWVANLTDDKDLSWFLGGEEPIVSDVYDGTQRGLVNMNTGEDWFTCDGMAYRQCNFGNELDKRSNFLPMLAIGDRRVIPTGW